MKVSGHRSGHETFILHDSSFILEQLIASGSYVQPSLSQGLMRGEIARDARCAEGH